MHSDTVARLVNQHREQLSRGERRVAEVVLMDPQSVAFGTVANLAQAANTSGATVIRLAAKLGLDGFAALQSAVQNDLASQLRPAAERIREPVTDNVVSRVLAVETDNLHTTLGAISPSDFEQICTRIAQTPGRLLVLAGDCAVGVAALFVDQMGMLRPGVELLEGNTLRVGRIMADIGEPDTLIAIDVRRYDAFVLNATQRAADMGAFVISCSDSPLSGIAEQSKIALTVSAHGAGPFDSQVATLALLNALLVAAAAQLSNAASNRLDRIENNWRTLHAFTN